MAEPTSERREFERFAQGYADAIGGEVLGGIERIEPGAEQAHRDDLARDVARLWQEYFPGDYYPDLPRKLTDALDRLADAYDGNAEAVPLRWHYGPTETDSDPGKRWHDDCGGEVWCIDDADICSKCSQRGTC